MDSNNPAEMSTEQTKYVALTSNKSKKLATKLCLAGILFNLFMSAFMYYNDIHFPILLLGGLHRFYVGKIWTGLLYTFTVGFMFIGSIVDLIKLMMGQFTDNVGQPLRR